MSVASNAFHQQRQDVLRMSQLLRDHPDSEWATLARFKIAMARFRKSSWRSPSVSRVK